MKEKKPINLEIGQNVKQIRENAGLTQERLAELIGLGVKHLSAIECGAVGVSLATLKQLCVLLSVPADAILFGIESSNSEAVSYTHLDVYKRQVYRESSSSISGRWHFI